MGVPDASGAFAGFTTFNGGVAHVNRKDLCVASDRSGRTEIIVGHFTSCAAGGEIPVEINLATARPPTVNAQMVRRIGLDRKGDL